MEDQVRYLTNLGIPAIAITNFDDVDIIQQVLNNEFIAVFGSRECLLSTGVDNKHWGLSLSVEALRRNL